MNASLERLQRVASKGPADSLQYDNHMGRLPNEQLLSLWVLG